MGILRNKILARMYLHIVNTPTEWEMNHHQLFTLLQRRVGDSQLVIEHLTDSLFQTAIQELLDRQYLAKTNSHGTIYLHLTEKGEERARSWLSANLGPLQTARPQVTRPQTNRLRAKTVSSSVRSEQEDGDIGCGLILVIAAVIVGGLIIYVLREPALKPALFCTSPDYKKNVRIVTEREEVWRKDAGLGSPAIGKLPQNTELQIIDGPKSSEGGCWWKVQTNTGNATNTAWQTEGLLPEKNDAGQMVFKKRP